MRYFLFESNNSQKWASITTEWKTNEEQLDNPSTTGIQSFNGFNVCFLFTVLSFETSRPVLWLDIIGRTMSHSISTSRTIFVYIFLICRRMHATDTQTWHRTRQIQIWWDPQWARVWIQNVKVITRQTVLHHHSF